MAGASLETDLVRRPHLDEPSETQYMSSSTDRTPLSFPWSQRCRIWTDAHDLSLRSIYPAQYSSTRPADLAVVLSSSRALSSTNDDPSTSTRVRLRPTVADKVLVDTLSMFPSRCVVLAMRSCTFSLSSIQVEQSRRDVINLCNSRVVLAVPIVRMHHARSRVPFCNIPDLHVEA